VRTDHVTQRSRRNGADHRTTRSSRVGSPMNRKAVRLAAGRV
jgi:hypothetical protein